MKARSIFCYIALALVFIAQGCVMKTFRSGTDEETLLSSSGRKSFETKAKWSVTRSVLHGGKQEGVELLTIDNGKLLITVIPTRGMGILDVRQKDSNVRLGWNSGSDCGLEAARRCLATSDTRS